MAFVLVLIFLLIYFIRPQDFWPFIQGERLVFITLGLASLLAVITTLFTKKRIFRAPQSVFMVGFSFAAVLSTYNVHWQQFTLDMFIYFGKVCLVYYLVSDLIDSQNKLKVFTWVLVSACTVLGIFGILQYYGIDITGMGLAGQLQIIDGKEVISYRIRGAGIFDTNQLAYSMGFVMPLAFALFMTSRFIGGKVVSVASMIVFGYCTYLTQSRGGLMAFMGPLLLLITVRGRLTVRFFTMIIAGLVVFTILSGSERFSTVFRYKEDKSAMARLDAWYLGSLIFRQHPIIGVGVHQFRETGYRTGIVSHNGYVQVAAEIGLIGLFFWSGLLYFSFSTLMRLQGKTPKTKYAMDTVIFARCFFIALIQFLVACFFSGDAFDFTIYLIFGAVVASEAIARRDKLIEAPQPGSPLVARRDVVKVMGVMMLILVSWKLAMMALL